MKAKTKTPTDPKQAQVAEMREQIERITQRILEIEAEPPADPESNHRRNELLQRLRRERGSLHRLCVNTEIFRLGGIPK